jgi:hypothetical protein
MVIDRSTIPLEMLGEPDDTECPHGIPTGMGIECWECRYEELNKDHIALEDDYAALEQELRDLKAEYATDVGRLTSDLRYIQGIVERGTGKPVDEALPITGQILEYVKSLEREKK